MIQEGTYLAVADNTGARSVRCFRIIGQRKKYAYLGDLIRVSVREAQPGGTVKKGQVCHAVIVRTGYPITRPDGSTEITNMKGTTETATLSEDFSIVAKEAEQSLKSFGEQVTYRTFQRTVFKKYKKNRYGLYTSIT